VDCTAQTRLGSSEHIRSIFDRAARQRVPVSGAFDLTYRCNFRCRHCYAGHLAGQSRVEARELGTAQLVDLLEQAADAGCLMLVLSGGEPLLRHDFLDLYVTAKRLGMLVTVFTNGSLVDERHLEVFAEYPPHEIEVSLYGTCDATYERVTGLPGSYTTVRRSLDLLLERGMPVGLKTMVLRDNEGEIAGMDALAQSLGLTFRLDPLIVPRLDGDPAPLEQRVDPERAVALEMEVDAYREAMAKSYREWSPVTGSEAAPVDRLYLCGAGQASFHVDPQGGMHPCLLSPIEYDAVAMRFQAAWQAVNKAVDEARWAGIGGCAGCADILLCGYCPGLFALENTSPSRPPDYLCRLGEHRRRALSCDELEVAGVNAH
jgi:radical SAM protein with 4Fe4S-binding SPASM domain